MSTLLREVTLQGSHGEEGQGFKPRSLPVALEVSLPCSPWSGEQAVRLRPSALHHSSQPGVHPPLPPHTAPSKGSTPPTQMPRVLLTQAAVAVCFASSPSAP